MSELRGKGWRVLGYLIWMLGAGMVLDGDGGAAAPLVLICGAALFTAGVVQSVRGEGEGGA
jgi:hypothetical protein